MTPERSKQIADVYDAALAHVESQRHAFLIKACAGDDALRREVDSLLARPASAQGFLPYPAADLASPLMNPAGGSLLTGRRVGPYEVQGLIGAGGMGEVYRARDTKLGRDVGIKILPRPFASDPERLARFAREARLLASLNHPHIGAIYGFEDADGVHALVLELIEGPTVADRIAQGAMSLDDALPIAKQIADALEAAHEQGIIHRDLKPANIKVRVDGTVKVLDFGLAKALESDGTSNVNVTQSPTTTSPAMMTGVGMILGTAAYMSPEQARGRPADKRSDIWAFGCVLYEMLTGRRAFPGDTVSDTIAAVLGREPDWSVLPAETPRPIRRLLQRCLEKHTKRRLHDIADARIEIDDVSREPITSAIETRAIDGARQVPATRNTWALVAAASVLVTLGALAVVRWRPAPVALSGLSLARLMITLPASQALEKGRIPPVAVSPDGKLLVYTAAADGGRTNLYLRALDELTPRSMASTEGASSPFFSPDGRWVAFYANGALKKVSIAGGVPLVICDAPPVWSATWGEHERIVFSTTLPSSGLWLVSANGGEPVQITTLKAGDAQHGYPQLLSGGTHVLFSVRRENGWQLASLDLKSRDWRLLGNGRVIGEGARYLPTGHLVYAQAGGLVATPFDPSTGSLDQPPVPLLERIETARFGGTSFVFAADAGTLVYVPASTTVTDRTLLRVDREGRVSPIIEPRAGYEHPALSSDGRRVAVAIASETGHDIWIIDLERATRIRLTSGGTSAFPVWGPGRASVSFQSSAPGPWNLFSKPLDGSEAQPLLRVADSSAPSWPNPGASLLPGTLPTLSGAGPQFPVSWAPDGATLAFHERKPNGERDIWVVSPDSDPVPFLLTPFDERSPQFSPDGKWLAYVSDESGRNDVYVQPFPGPGPKWLVSTDGGIDPLWSRDGRELFYRHNDQMMAVLVASKGEFSTGRPQRLFEIRFDAGDDGPNYDVSPDGKWFVMPRSERGQAPGELHLVLNWFGEVRARAQASARHSHNSLPQLAALWEAGQKLILRSPVLLAAGLSQTQAVAAETSVRDTLLRYSAALESLDAKAVRKVQPSIPEDTLAKAFKDMRELKVAIDAVRVLSTDGDIVRVSCRVAQTVTPRVGSKQTTTVTRVMRLRREADAWVIDGFER